MSANNDMKQTINDLYEIQNRWDEYLEKDEEYDNLKAEKEEAEQEVARKWVNVGEKFDKEARKKLPKRATRPAGWSKKITEGTKWNLPNPKPTIVFTALCGIFAKRGLVLLIATFLVSLVFGIFCMILKIDEDLRIVLSFPISFLYSVSVIGSIVGFLFSRSQMGKEMTSRCRELALPDDKAPDAKWAGEFNAGMTNEALDKFYKEFQKYDAAFLSYVDDCKKKVDEIVSDYGEERSATTLEYLEAMQAKVDEITPILEEIENNTVLHKDYVPYAARLARLIESGRADTLKEAINLMLDDVRKDKEEAERRDEARRQEEETRRHNMAMQRVAEQEARDARAHNAAMEKAARDQAAAAKAQAQATQRAAEDARRQAQQAERTRKNQEEKARSDALRRCNGCAKSGRCTMRGTVNCTAFRPR